VVHAADRGRALKLITIVCMLSLRATRLCGGGIGSCQWLRTGIPMCKRSIPLCSARESPKQHVFSTYCTERNRSPASLIGVRQNQAMLLSGCRTRLPRTVHTAIEKGLHLPYNMLQSRAQEPTNETLLAICVCRVGPVWAFLSVRETGFAGGCTVQMLIKIQCLVTEHPRPNLK